MTAVALLLAVAQPMVSVDHRHIECACSNVMKTTRAQNVIPSGIIRLKKLRTGPGVGTAVEAGVCGARRAGLPVLAVLQSSPRASRLLVQSAKYINRNTSTRNQIRDVTMTTLSVSAVRRFIVQVSAVHASLATCR